MEWLGIGGIGIAAFGFIASIWSKIKSVAWRISGLLIKRVDILEQETARRVIGHFRSNLKMSSNYDAMYGADWVVTNGKSELVPYERLGNRMHIFWNGWFPIIFQGKTEFTEKKDETVQNRIPISSTLSYLRWTFDIDKFLITISSNYTNEHRKQVENAVYTRFEINHIDDSDDSPSSPQVSKGSKFDGVWWSEKSVRLLSHDAEKIGGNPVFPSLDRLILSEEIKSLVEEVRRWRKSNQWYSDRGIPWKRGYLLYGIPGTGKTALVRGLAEDMQIPLNVFSLSEMDNNTLRSKWKSMRYRSPCIALFEDIDSVFHGRENITKMSQQINVSQDKSSKTKNPVTFDCLLNCIDGVDRNEGIIVVITTNDLSKIDPALGFPRVLEDGSTEFISTRPGRIDKAIELGYMDKSCKRQMTDRILGCFENEHANMLNYIEQDIPETPAQFQERCAQIALKCYWAEDVVELELQEIM